MRILFCNYEYPPLGGGGGVINALLAEELAKRHEVTVLTSRGLGLESDSTESGVRIVRVPVLLRRSQSTATMASMMAYVVSGTVAGRRLLRTTEFDVINTHFVVPTGPVGAGLAHFGGIPNVVSVHGGDLYDPSKRSSPHRHATLRYVIRSLLNAADDVIAQSHNTAANVHKYYLPQLDVRVIPLAIRRPSPGVMTRAELGLASEDTVLVTIGRLVARKAIDQLVALLADLREIRAKLLVIGDGPQAEMLSSHAQELGVADSVRLLGHVAEAEKFRILRAADAYVSTSQHEGFGLVFLEAMACGLPVVCYDHGGQTDFLTDGETGFVVPLNDRALFSSRCRQLALDDEMRKAMGDHNLELAETFLIERCAERYESVFERVVETSSCRRRQVGYSHRA